LSPRKSSRDKSWTSVGKTQVLCIVTVVNMLRSWDGLTLYAVSSDGTLAAFCFDADELEGIAPHSVQQQYLQKFGFTLPPLPEGWSHTNLPVPSPGQRMTPPPSPNRSSHHLHGLNGFGAPSTSTGHEVVNTLIAKRKTKRRAQLGPRGDPDSPVVLANSSTYHDSLNHMHSHMRPVAMAISSGQVPDISRPPCPLIHLIVVNQNIPILSRKSLLSL